MTACQSGANGNRRLVAAAMVGLTLAAISVAGAVRADAPADCKGFQWDMSRELALFRTDATTVRAAPRTDSMPRLEVGRVYQIEVLPQGAVGFAQPPGGRRTVEDPHAGLLMFVVPTSAHYRISADGPVWIDVVAGDRVIASSSYSGHARCSLIHKSVDLELPAQTQLILQLSQSPSGHVRLAITPAPDPAAPAQR
jgi:hypothetical protein